MNSSFFVTFHRVIINNFTMPTMFFIANFVLLFIAFLASFGNAVQQGSSPFQQGSTF